MPLGAVIKRPHIQVTCHCTQPCSDCNQSSRSIRVQTKKKKPMSRPHGELWVSTVGILKKIDGVITAPHSIWWVLFSPSWNLRRPTFPNLHDHLCGSSIVISSHSEAQPCEGPIQVPSIRVCAPTICQFRFGAEVFVVEYEGHPPSGVWHIVAIIFIQRDWRAATSVKLL